MNIFYPTRGILVRCAHPLSPTSRRLARRGDAARHARLRDGVEKLGRPGSDAFDPRTVADADPAGRRIDQGRGGGAAGAGGGG